MKNNNILICVNNHSVYKNNFHIQINQSSLVKVS